MNYVRCILASSLAAAILWSGGAARAVGEGSQVVASGDPGMTPQRAASTVVKIAGRNVRFTVNLYRNLMPPVDEASSRIVTTISVSTIDPRGLPVGLAPTTVKLLQGRQVWTGPFARTGVADLPNAMVRQAFNGPNWRESSRANAIVECKLGGRTYRVGVVGAVVNVAY
jgi:hypothetical protein